ncbi:DUF3365 domain-containing protein [Subsaximicrobium wynnwilliamsii]|uniref:DUF3365 domain-containing protein n=1 Tax=Subsaximicrobium wynnwilliamsii TaxID=291179 RepID=A0A5C6ZL32_9FLAO|nr:DUF3365 domain-containing protein [Subsaximicrobium wynnwilliamsii]TXD84416.1 DUF3365 domain-containing protein [Subsaximicrobium wynnwilliamsii]TXD90097.1 DUF3365 domain-containing protein [Subsaximicrobium wynnwilliamsii]TXE04149.1 DUF3365 domain-containing protein [Subsaximicrobium wynnwilliamsii]
MKKTILLSMLLVSFLSCKNSEKTEYVAAEEIEDAQPHPGKKLMETNCYVCHSPSASQADRIGPPMIAVKKHYINESSTKAAFISDLQAWIKNPTAAHAKMYGAVKRFGVMPKTVYPEETIALIGDYMFDNAIEQPEWFEAHFNGAKGKGKGAKNGMGKAKSKQMQKQQAAIDFENLSYAERGLKYAMTTKAVLGKNLMQAIQNEGTLGALAFCNEEAYPLTDSMAVVLHASIKRVSDKPRNQNNQANDEELEYIETFKQVIANQEEPNPIVKELDDKVQVYYPITTNTMCLQCHGKPNKTMQAATLQKISLLYPKDNAIGYDVNEVRGIWRISFDN